MKYVGEAWIKYAEGAVAISVGDGGHVFHTDYYSSILSVSATDLLEQIFFSRVV